MNVNFITKLLVVGSVALTLNSYANAQTAEVEPNSSEDTAQILDAGVLVVTGALNNQTTAATAIITRTEESFAAGEVASFAFGTGDGLLANTDYQIETFESTDPDPDTDTLLGQFEAPYVFGGMNTLIDFNDQGGEGNFSLLDVSTDDSGNLFFAVTDFEDEDFVGASDFPGNFGFSVSTPGVFDDSADYFNFTGLDPGTEYTATTSSNGDDDVDTLLVFFADDPDNDAENDDIDFDNGNLFSQIVFTADLDGEALIIVTGSGDGGLNGGYATAGSYRLELVANAVPEPSSTLVLASFGLIGLMRRRQS